MISPTGVYEIRNDRWGEGHFGAKRENGRVRHHGIDYLCDPEQDVYAPVHGVIKKIVKRFPNDTYTGVLIENKNTLLPIFYIQPDRFLLGKKVVAGQIIGRAQDISKKFPGMHPHVHVEMIVNPDLFMNFP